MTEATFKKAKQIRRTIERYKEAEESILDHIKTFRANDDEKATYHDLIEDSFSKRIQKIRRRF